MVKASFRCSIRRILQRGVEILEFCVFIEKQVGSAESGINKALDVGDFINFSDVTENEFTNFIGLDLVEEGHINGIFTKGGHDYIFNIMRIQRAKLFKVDSLSQSIANIIKTSGVAYIFVEPFLCTGMKGERGFVERAYLCFQDRVNRISIVGTSVDINECPKDGIRKLLEVMHRWNKIGRKTDNAMETMHLGDDTVDKTFAEIKFEMNCDSCIGIRMLCAYLCLYFL